MDASFSSVLQKRYIEFIKKPVVIFGEEDPIKMGVVLMASYEVGKF